MNGGVDVIRSDFHMHTNFSTDADRGSTPECMIEEAIRRGLDTICITDHQDVDFGEGNDFRLDFEKYILVLNELKQKYKKQIDVRIGVEFGLQPHLDKVCGELVNKYPFDFVIGSVHSFDGIDPYYGAYFKNRTDEEGYRRAFEITLDNVKAITDFDVLGHVDYVVRYGNEREKSYLYRDYSDLIDEILKILIENGKGLEFNTAGFKYGLPFAHPHSDILKRYKEFGGEIVTVGSDGHKPEHLAYDFHRVTDILKDCGFKYYTEFKGRKAHFRQLP